MSEQEQMTEAGFLWEPTDSGFPRWTCREKGVFCVRRPELSDEEWAKRLQDGISEANLNLPPSAFAALGQPCCSRWSKSEIEWMALGYVQALANGGDTWRPLTRERVAELLTPEQLRRTHGLFKDDYYERWFKSVSTCITNSDGAFTVGGFWNRSRAMRAVQSNREAAVIDLNAPFDAPIKAREARERREREESAKAMQSPWFKRELAKIVRKAMAKAKIPYRPLKADGTPDRRFGPRTDVSAEVGKDV